MDKDDGAFLTIGELARQLGVAQHILRYWETRFPQLKPLQRSGNRRYYRPHDVDVARHINRLLDEEGFTVRGAQRVLAGRGDSRRDDAASVAAPLAATVPLPAAPASVSLAPQGELPGLTAPASRPVSYVGDSDIALLIARLTVIRQNLLEAIEQG